MSTHIIGTHQLVEALKAEGFPIPEQCREARIVMGVNSAFIVQYDVFVTVENLARLGRAFQRMAEANENPAEPAKTP